MSDQARRAVIHLLIFATCFSAIALHAASYHVTNFAGAGGNTGPDDGSGTAARFNSPSAVAVDKSTGNVYVADSSNNTIRVISPAGVVSTFAGLAGVYGAADGTGAAASFYLPKGLAVDSAGTVYVADTYNHLIRKITSAGVVTTLAGTAGTVGSADGVGSAARFNYPLGLAVDAGGNVYVADSASNTIRKISVAGVVTTLAGSAGTSGTTDGLGAAARFYNPEGLTVDASGTVYVADTYNHTIRKIAPDGTTTTLAGTAGTLGIANGTGTAATFYYPSDVTVDGGGNVFVADSYNLVIRKITSGGVVTTFAGAATFGGADGTGVAATFSYPSAIAIDSAANLYVADLGNNTIRKITSAAVVSTLAGTKNNIGATNATGTLASFYYPQGIAVDSAGTFYVADSGNYTIRKVTPAGAVTLLAGTAGTSGTSDGTGSSALFNYPEGLAVDSAKNVYVADTYNHTIRKISPAGVVTTLAGTAGTTGSTDGTGGAAKFNYPTGVALDSVGNLYVADSGNYTIRMITPSGVVSTYAGSAGSAGSADGVGAAARFYVPFGIASDSSNNLYVTDQYNQTIRIISPGGSVSTLAGSVGVVGSSDGTGSAAKFNYPLGLTVDSGGNVYVADYGNETIRKIAPGGIVTTLAGTAVLVGSSNGTGPAARFYSPSGIALDASGNFYVADSGNNNIRVGKPTISDVATIDSTTGSVGVLRQLGTAPQTATSWLWSIYRKPANSSASLSAPTSRTPTFTPDRSDNYIFQLTATSVSGTSISFVSLSTANVAPQITSDSTATGYVGTYFTYQIVATGFPAPTYSATGLPDGLSLVNGYIVGTPTTNGTSIISLTATNGVGADAQATLTLTTYQAPTIVSSLNASGQVGSFFTYTIQALGAPAPSLSASPLPPGLSFVGATIFGTPTTQGQTSVTLTATNGISPNDTKTLVITIAPAPVPALASASPNVGPLAGGGTVTLTGTNFIAGAAVTIGGVQATNVVVISGTSITCTVPAHSAGAADIVVLTAGGSTTLSGGFTYVTTPGILSISPNRGPLGGGQSVTITGFNFIAGATVTIGGVAATNIVVNSTSSISCVTPGSAAGAVDVVVTTNLGTTTSAGSYTYVLAPAFSTVAPNNGPAIGGNTITLTGTDFISGASVTIGGKAATQVTVVSATQLTCVVPSSTIFSAVDVVLTTAGGSATSVGGYTYTHVPTLASISPSSGLVSGGQLVTLTGSEFNANSVVTIGGSTVASINILSTTQIAFNTPAHAAGAVDVTITTNFGSATLTNGYTYVSQPTLTSVTPNSGPITGGTNVVIVGTNFITGATVTFGGTAATKVTVISSNAISCATPAHASGAVDVVLSLLGGTTTLAGGFTYSTAPAITNANTTSFVIGTPGSFTFTTSGTPKATLAVTSGTVPSGLTLVDNGDGTATLSGTPASGTSGNTTLTITATNSGGSAKQTFTIQIIAPTAIVGTGPDSDGDGFSDAFETAVGTSPIDANATPFGTAKASAPVGLTLSKPTIALNFAKQSSDSIKFSGTLNVPAGFVVTGAKVYVDVGGVARAFTLDAKGTNVVGTDSIKISIKATKGVVAAQTAKYSVTIAKGTYLSSLTSSGLTNATVSGISVTVPFSVLFNTTVYKTAQRMTYTAVQGKSGTAK